MKTSHKNPLAFALASVMLLLLATGCDLFAPAGGENTITVRPLSASFLSRKAVSYSGYRAGQSPATAIYPTTAQIDEDLSLISAGGFGLIRLFDSSDAFSKIVLQEIAAHPEWNLRVQLGAYINVPGGANDALNATELERVVALANAYPAIVLAVSVGNETMVDWSFVKVDPLVMKGFIKTVRDQIAQPVTTDDNWAFFANDGGGYTTDAILSTVDYVSMHSYPMMDVPYADDPAINAYWDWRQTAFAEGPARAAAMMDASVAKLQKDFAAVKTYLDAQGFGDRAIVVGETGWKAAQTSGEIFLAHPMNQKMYYDRLTAWTANAPAKIFWFEAFDEPWKAGDDGWGLFDVNRKARFVLRDLFGTANRLSATYTEADALYYKPLPQQPAVTATTYSLLQDTVPSGAAVSGSYTWTGWDNPWTASGDDTVVSTQTDGGTMFEVTPVPKSWGWGMFAYVAARDNLSNFASGHLNFSVKTTYPGAIEVGFYTRSETSAGCDVYVKVDPESNSFGYDNDGTWHDVSIPIATLAAAAAVPTAFDLSRVESAFTIADRYSYTGKTSVASGTGSTAIIDLDNIYWSKD